MITQLYSSGNNYTKMNNKSPSNNNKTLSCYHRPLIYYNMNTKSKNKRKTIKEKSFNYSINNKENININLIHNKKNFFGIYKNINNNKRHISKNIAFLCGVINSLNKTNPSKKINSDIKKMIKEVKEEYNKDNKDIKNKLYLKDIKGIITIQKWWKKLYTNKISNDYYYFSFKKLISPPTNISNINLNSNSNINLIKSFQAEEGKIMVNNKLRKIFVTYITQIFYKFFMLILHKLNWFNFIKILTQRINKGINQYVFYVLYYNNINNINNINNTSNNTIFFFETIKRHVKANLNMDENNINEISILLRTNIPKYFKQDFSRKYIPYITPIQENKLINTQLFLLNNEKLINYIFYFLEKEKGEKINDKNKTNYKKYIKNDLSLNKLKNRNIFGIMRYINILKQNFEGKNKLYKKLQLLEYKDSYHSENVKEDIYNKDIEDKLEDNISCDFAKNIDIKKFKIKFHYMNNINNE